MRCRQAARRLISRGESALSLSQAARLIALIIGRQVQLSRGQPKREPSAARRLGAMSATATDGESLLVYRLRCGVVLPLRDGVGGREDGMHVMRIWAC